ncbi:hypothetical protein HOY82DRAFT_575013 [Tuber indicum]|nr:hypothetical protein HOY82DRAFT_575013 [Tuber indicum]
MLLSFPPMSGKTFVSSQTYSCAEGREEGLGWPFVITIIVFLFQYSRIGFINYFILFLTMCFLSHKFKFS